MTNIIRQIQDDIEFFTIEATGESGMSQSGLAKLCGKTQQAISKLIFNLTTKSPSKWLEPWVNKDLSLTTTTKEGGELSVLNGEFCAAVIQHYAFSGSEIAQYSLTKFASLGINLWIQEITGYKKEKPKTSAELAVEHAQLFLEQERRQLALEAEQKAQAEKLLLVEAETKANAAELGRITSPYGDYISVMGYANLLKMNLGHEEAKKLGRKATILCRKQGIKIEKVKDPRFGEVGSYPESILFSVFSKYN